jgi:hypothetical protein
MNMDEDTTNLAAAVLKDGFTDHTETKADGDAPAEDHPELRVADRCDQCGAQAFLVARMSSSDLLFCGHHAARHLEALTEQGATIFDFRDRLLDNGEE